MELRLINNVLHGQRVGQYGAVNGGSITMLVHNFCLCYLNETQVHNTPIRALAKLERDYEYPRMCQL